MTFLVWGRSIGLILQVFLELFRAGKLGGERERELKRKGEEENC